jgi:hypothetical protein
MTAEEKVARQKLSVLELAQALGNVSEACRQRGVSRTQFYEYKSRAVQRGKRRFPRPATHQGWQTHGLAGLKDLPPIHKSHPFTTSPEVEERILESSLEHPSWGCTRLSHWLKLEGISVSSPTVQRILIKHEMGSRYERWLKLEERQASDGMELTGEQVAFIERQPVLGPVQGTPPSESGMWRALAQASFCARIPSSSVT